MGGAGPSLDLACLLALTPPSSGTPQRWRRNHVGTNKMARVGAVHEGRTKTKIYNESARSSDIGRPVPVPLETLDRRECRIFYELVQDARRCSGCQPIGDQEGVPKGRKAVPRGFRSK